MANRLQRSLSPYLRQHAENPVDWWEWGPEAFAEAQRRDVPLLISVGYAACHWCHVMAHESFEDGEVARLVNAHTVPVKVDREERPDVDAVYMTATQAMTGQGGWPMTVFATPDGDPFHCGTYYPRPHFLRLVTAVEQAWRERRDEVVAAGRRVVDAISDIGSAPAGDALEPELLDAAAATLHRDHDRTNGGFGGAPKFPPSMVLEFLLRHHERSGDAASLDVVRHTCERMARGGMYDQLGGGFARYSVDDRWVVPHFEKMLYDNALLLRAYTHLWRRTGDPLAERVARETAAFLLADLRTGQGFASALDADTDGVEGLTYVWTPAQLAEALGEDDGAWAADLLTVTKSGTFEDGASVLQLLSDPDDHDRWQQIRARLREVRATRPQPMRDDKVVAAWNGLTITALVELAWALEACAEETGQGTLAEEVATAAREAGEFLAGAHLVDGRLRRVSRDGEVGDAVGVLEDYGCVAEAFCALHQLTTDGRWLDLAGQLLGSALDLFPADGGGFFDTASDAERLAVRPRDPSDNATPSGQSSLAAALVTYSALAGSARHREVAVAALATVAPIVARHPRFAGAAAAVGEALAVGPPEVAVVGGGAAADVLRRTSWQAAPGGAVVVAGSPDADGVPLLAGRALVAGGAAAYVCRGFVCDLPVTTPEDLSVRLMRH